MNTNRFRKGSSMNKDLPAFKDKVINDLLKIEKKEVDIGKNRMTNPWEVDSLQAFLTLKCPECEFCTDVETLFQAHAVANHPLSLGNL